MLASFRRFPWRDVPVYIAAQISGGVVVALVLTSILAIVIFAAVDTRKSFAPNLPLFALWIGFIIAFIIMVEAPLTMACINPARDLGPPIAITMLVWGAAAFPGVGRPWWVWTVGPILGALAGRDPCELCALNR